MTNWVFATLEYHDVNLQPEELIKSLRNKKHFHTNCVKSLLNFFQSDAGLTGRKIIVDTYGGWGAHGGGAFSGKDFTKVDRSAAYAARWVAKSLVKAGLCRRCLVQVAYAIGVAEPLSITVFDYGTSKLSQKELLAVVKNNFDLRPGKIVKYVELSVIIIACLFRKPLIFLWTGCVE